MHNAVAAIVAGHLHMNELRANAAGFWREHAQRDRHPPPSGRPGSHFSSPYRRVAAVSTHPRVYPKRDLGCARRCSPKACTCRRRTPGSATWCRATKASRPNNLCTERGVPFFFLCAEVQYTYRDFEEAKNLSTVS